jgi:branched-chain amino acid transport system permease protein
VERISAKRIVVLLLVGAAVALLALILGEGQLRYLGRIVMLAGAAMSLNLLIGNVGLISMGHGLFMGIGAYIVAVPNVKYGVTLSWTIPAALLFSLVIGIVGSVIVLRARALFFSLLTLALGQVAYVLVSRN